MKEVIHNFLNSSSRKKGNFLKGCALLRQIGADAEADHLETFRFALIIPPTAWSRLFNVLKESCSGSHSHLRPLDVSPDVPAAHPAAGQEESLDQPTPSAPNEALIALRAQLKKLMKRRAFLHGRMVFTSEEPPGPARKKKLHDLARLLMEEVQPPIDRTIEKLNRIEATGEVPADLRPPAFDEAAALIRRRNSKRSSLSRYRALLKKEDLDDPARAHYEKKCLELQGEVKRLTAKIEGAKVE